MRVQRAHVKMGRCLVGIVDPHRHIDHVDFAEAAAQHPFFRQRGGGCEAVIEVDAVAQVVLTGERDHLFGFGDAVGDRLFTEHGIARGQQLHGRRVVVAAVFGAGGRDAGGIKFDAAFEQGLHRVESLTAEGLSRFVGAFLNDVADGDDFRFWMIGVTASVIVADPAHADNGYA